MHRRLLRVPAAPFLVALALASSACGGGGNDDPPSGCTRAAIPATGPGDALNHFPVQVGRSWTYGISTGGTGTVTVTGAQPFGTETAAVFTSSTAAGSPTTELVVKRPAGVYVVSSPGAEPPFDQLYPELVLPFPIAPGPATEQVRCRALDVGDLDGDGRADHADITASLQIVSASEALQVPVRPEPFTSVAHVRVLAHVTVTATFGGTVTVDATQDVWYAPDVGRLRFDVIVTALGSSDTSSSTLTSFTVPPASAGFPASPLARSAPSPAATTLEASAARLARLAVGAR